MTILLCLILGVIGLLMYLAIGLVVGAMTYRKHNVSRWSWKTNVVNFIKTEGQTGIVIYLVIWPVFIYFEVKESSTTPRKNTP